MIKEFEEMCSRHGKESQQFYQMLSRHEAEHLALIERALEAANGDLVKAAHSIGHGIKHMANLLSDAGIPFGKNWRKK